MATYQNSKFKRFLLYGLASHYLGLALLLAVLSPPVVAAQVISPNGGNYAADFAGPYNDWWLYWVYNGDERSAIDMITLSRIPVPANNIYFYDPEGWQGFPVDEDDGTSNITWLANSPLYPGGWKAFWIYISGTWTMAQGGWCALGPGFGNCGPIWVPSR